MKYKSVSYLHYLIDINNFHFLLLIWETLIFKKYLKVGQGFHPLHRTGGSQRQRDVYRLVGRNRWNVERLRRNEAETVLVQLDAKTVHQLHGAIAEGHVHVDGAVLAGEGSADFEAFALRGRKPLELGRDVEGGGGRAAQAEDIAEQGVGRLKKKIFIECSLNYSFSCILYDQKHHNWKIHRIVLLIEKIIEFFSVLVFCSLQLTTSVDRCYN